MWVDPTEGDYLPEDHQPRDNEEENQRGRDYVKNLLNRLGNKPELKSAIETIEEN